MEIKVTFRFDASDSLLACVDNFRKAMEAMAASGGLTGLPASKEVGIVKAVATEDGVTVNKKERIWPPVDGGDGADEAKRPDGPDGTAAPSPAPSSAPAVAAAAAAPKDEPKAASQPGEKKDDGTSFPPSVPSVADMRAAVARCRARIEGEDWESKTSEGYKLYHKKVTAAVKKTVAFCGAEKVPDIPEEKRASFIRDIDDLVLVDSDVIPQPPF